MYRETLQLMLKMQYQPKYICKICGCGSGVGLFLNTFRILANTSRHVSKVAKIAFQLRHVRLSARIHQLVCHWTDSYKILYWCGGRGNL